MLIRLRLQVIVALALALPVPVGCSSGSRIAGDLSSFPWVVTSGVPDSRDDLKDPTQLDLSHGQWQEQLGNLSAAEQSYKRVLESNPQSLDAKLGLARLAQLSGDSEAAEAIYLEAVKADPENALALDALGQFYAAGHRWKDAIATLRHATELAPDDATTRYHYAVALARSGDIAAAQKEFARSVGEAEGYYNIGYILREQGQLAAAEQAFQKAIEIQPNLAVAQTMLAEIRQGNSATALAANRAARMMPPQAVVQTAAGSQSQWNPHVTPASAVEPQASLAVAEAPADTPSTTRIASSPTQPVADASVAESVTVDPPTLPAQDLPRWEMPTRREPALLSTEQVDARSMQP